MPEIKAPRLAKKGKKSQAEEIDELMHYLQPSTGLGISIQRQLQTLPKRYVILLVAPKKKYGMLSFKLAEHFVRKRIPGIFVTTNKSASEIINHLSKAKLDGSRVFFVDAVTKKSNQGEGGNIAFAESPENLTELDAAVDESSEKLPAGEKFFVLDSLSTMLVYRPERIVEKFVHTISGKLRARQFKAIFTLASYTRSETVNVLAQFCDKIIEL